MLKRPAAMLIPYYICDGLLHVFLQRRDANATRNPLMLGAFGGGLENQESFEEALMREIKEELNYVPTGYNTLGIFETEHSIAHYFVEEVDRKNFKNQITVLEGKAGEWHVAMEVIGRSDISPNTERVISTVINKITDTK